MERIDLDRMNRFLSQLRRSSEIYLQHFQVWVGNFNEFGFDVILETIRTRGKSEQFASRLQVNYQSLYMLEDEVFEDYWERKLAYFFESSYKDIRNLELAL